MDIPVTDGLEGKVVIVTGAGARGDGIGNGRAAAILLAASGARVLCVDREIELAEGTVAMIESSGNTASAFAADVTRQADCEAMVEAALSAWGRLDVLDNNVGIGSRGSVVVESYERWRRVMEVNVDSMFLSSKAAIPVMIAAGGGAII
ncbi:MAG: SDR family NAD(P)-dependent oxidoreductase, partial [Gammaproteobacteria bacterium]|nr:SDR family NAD(P)-dependent oxidoreductase [Gammaproteobacteria bacterium]